MLKFNSLIYIGISISVFCIENVLLLILVAGIDNLKWSLKSDPELMAAKINNTFLYSYFTCIFFNFFFAFKTT